MNKVSVITPAYNAAPFLEETVKSVQNQTFTDWEMIIVDDCSNDLTFAIAQNLARKDPRIKVFQNDRNSGVAITRNRALESANGKYVAFLDSDDLWLPQKLERQIEFMESKQYVFTYTNYKKFDSKTGKQQDRVIKAPAVMTAKQLYGDTSIGCLTVMVNREKTGPFYMPLLDHTEDNVTWQQLLARGYTGHRLDMVLSLYREGNSSLTSGKKKAAMQQWNTYRDYYKFSIPTSLFYFTQYAYHAIKKHYF